MFDRTEPAIGRTSRQTEAIPRRNCGCLSAFFILSYQTAQGAASVFIELYHDEYDPRRLVTRLHKTDPLTIYREGRAMGVNMAGYKKYLYQVFCIYNGSSKKNVLPMKF